MNVKKSFDSINDLDQKSFEKLLSLNDKFNNYQMHCRIVPGLLFIVFSVSTGAQELNVDINTRAKRKHFWKSSWISHPQASKTDYEVFHFRNEIDLEEIPDSFIVYVSADPRYRLYVNGQSVAFGPARGTLLYWRYETLDIAPYLVAGTNVLAAEVFNFGEHRLHFQQTIQTAFIFQAEEDAYRQLNTGTGKWKIKMNKAYAPLPYRHKPGGLYAVGPGDKVDASLYPWKQMMDLGLTTFAEKPEPTRSDCLAWSASPLYFYMTLVCGIEPEGFGFKRVNITPELGDLQFVNGSMPHPAGEIEINLRRKGKQGIEGTIGLPGGVTGTFIWNGEEIPLSPGFQKVAVN